MQDSTLFNSTARWKTRAKIGLLMRLSVPNYTLNGSAFNCSQVLCLLNSCLANEMTDTVGQVPGLVPIPASQLVLN